MGENWPKNGHKRPSSHSSAMFHPFSGSGQTPPLVSFVPLRPEMGCVPGNQDCKVKIGQRQLATSGKTWQHLSKKGGFLLAFTELWGENSVSSFQPVVCVPMQTHWFFCSQSSPSLAQNSVRFLFQSRTQETVFRLFPIKPIKPRKIEATPIVEGVQTVKCKP